MANKEDTPDKDAFVDSFEGCSVIFRNVNEYYLSNKAINCQFSVKESCIVDDPTDCFVGLFHVGWDSLNSCITKKSFTLVECLTNGGYGLDFQPNETPEPDYDEFYQFCFYNIKTEVVFGASCPFQICQLKDVESFFQVGSYYMNESSTNLTDDHSAWWMKNAVDEDLEDTVLIHNKTTMLEDSLAKTVEENEMLKISKVNYEVELRKCFSEKKEFEQETVNQLSTLKEKIDYQQEREAMLKQNLADADEIINHLTMQMKETKKSLVEEYEAKLNLYVVSLDKLKNELNRAVNEKTALLKDFEKKEKSFKDDTKRIWTEHKAEVDALIQDCRELQGALVAEKEKSRKLECDYQGILSSLTRQEETLGEEKLNLKEAVARASDLDLKLKAEKQRNHSMQADFHNLDEAFQTLRNERKHLENENKKLINELHEKAETIKELNVEHENMRDVLKELKTKQTTLTEAQQANISTLEDRVCEIETVLDSEREMHGSDLKQLEHQLKQKCQQINTLEDLVKSMKSEIATLNAAIGTQQAEANRMITELKNKQEELENNNDMLYKEKQMEKNNGPRSLDAGSRHALQVANAHMQKQLKHLKKERDNYQKRCDEPNAPCDSNTRNLRKENDELKLRLCMGKKAYEEKYLECQKVKAELAKLKDGKIGATTAEKPEKPCVDELSTNKLNEIDEIKSKYKETVLVLKMENECLTKKLSKEQEDLIQHKDREEEFLNNIEELKGKSTKLVNHYEGKIKLLEEENMMIKKQKTALLTGGVVCGVLKEESPVEQQPASVNEAVIYHPPSSIHRNTVVEQQPEVLGNISYPPSFNDGVEKRPWLPTTQKKQRDHSKQKPSVGKREVVVAPPSGTIHHPPFSQVINNRAKSSNSRTSSNALNGRGKERIHAVNQQPILKCPICQVDFPSGFSDMAATKHVNSHFSEQY